MGMRLSVMVLAVLAQLAACACAEEPAGAAIPQPKPKAASVSFTDVGLVEFEAPPDAWVIRYTLDGKAPTATSYACCTPIRVASSLTLKAACFGPDGKSSAPVAVECVRKPAEQKDAKPKAAINVDFSATPDLTEWALRAQKDAEEQYPIMAEKLGSEGFSPPRQIMLVFKDDPKLQIAATGGTTIVFARSWIKAHPTDTGTVIHELAHVIQSYKRKVPGWLTEGIADYIRWWTWEPPERRGRINPARAKYTNGYQDAAAFLYWAEKQYDKDLVRKLNDQARRGTYKDELFKEYTGKELDALWKEFVESLGKK
ncbi:MAG: basic secretory protein-like protein [Planctomycetota bacterium]|nr:basic secretory protein-like protein [Planctomycetota bacterium]